MIRKNLIYILLVLVLFFVFISLIYTQIRNKGAKSLPQETAIPFKIINPQSDKPDRATTYAVINEKSQAQIDKDALIGKLLFKLPYQGENFNLAYKTSPYRFIVNFKGDRQKGEAEFNSFLKQNGIIDKSWLKGLIIATN